MKQTISKLHVIRITNRDLNIMKQNQIPHKAMVNHIIMHNQSNYKELFMLT